MPQKALQIDRVAYEQWCRKLTLAPAAVSFLSTLRASSPVRRVASRAGNVSGMYPSRKMGVTIQFESQRPQLWAILVIDQSSHLLAFYDVPHTFKLRFRDTSAKRMPGHYYTPDFL